jgi:hypothetical protein
LHDLKKKLKGLGFRLQDLGYSLHDLVSRLQELGMEVQVHCIDVQKLGPYIPHINPNPNHKMH